MIILTVIFLIGGLFYDEINDFIEKKFYQHKVYKSLHYYAEENDQLLLNNVILYLGDDSDKPTVFDHILLADKYIYLVHDIYAKGALYGNIEDNSLFLKDYDMKAHKVTNEVIRNLARMRFLEKALDINPNEKLFFSVVVYNSSLIVPRELKTKTVGNLFLSVDELEKTIKMAEDDQVSNIKHEMTQKVLDMLLERSDKTKADLKKKRNKSV